LTLVLMLSLAVWGPLKRGPRISAAPAPDWPRSGVVGVALGVLGAADSPPAGPGRRAQSPQAVLCRTWPLLALVAGIAVAAGCGGDDEAISEQRSAQTKVGVEAPGIIAFRRYADAAETQGVIFTIRPDGTAERQVTRPPDGATDEFPQVSPDGRRIAWERCSENEPCAVYTAGIDGNDAKAVELTCTLKPVCDGANVAWHPDGDSLVATRASGRERQAGAGGWIQRSELVQVNLADGRQRVIARIDDWQGDLTNASWSPDGRRLAADHWFSAFHPRPGRRIDVVPADGGTPEGVTPLELNAGDGPEWSPNGDTLVFRTDADSEDGSGSQIATVRADGGGLRRLDPFGDQRPVRSSAWSPDGNWIVFAAQGKSGAFDLFVMTADGTRPRPLTRTPVTDSAPDWGGG
jgi:TolB protein